VRYITGAFDRAAAGEIARGPRFDAITARKNLNDLCDPVFGGQGSPACIRSDAGVGFGAECGVVFRPSCVARK
jgi:hypothetical protein